ncbi:TadE/TadG family type IV pilus assembly protein [Methylocystis heyeri]|nr:pilus assembly protein TadG-related protein [Methylocystis heyeri]
MDNKDLVSVSPALASFRSENSGAAAVMFGVAAVPLMLMLGVAIDTGRASRAKLALQQAADAAALAAAAQPGLTHSARQSLAQNVALANLSHSAWTATPAVTETESSGNYSVSATAQVNNTFMRLAGINTTAVAASATATAAAAGSPISYTHYAGNGSVAGDPHVGGADGTNGYLDCGTGGWYNLLSDSGIEVNVSCVNYSGDNMSVLQSFSILLGTHVISLYAPQPSFNSSGTASYDPKTAWFGAIAIDGVTYPPVIGTHSYLGGLVNTKITDLTNFYASDNMVNIKTATYNIFITYDEYAMGDINITATNAGLCGVPGGFWGGTLAGIDDYKAADFLVSGPTATTAQFNWSTCPTSTAATPVRLVK